MATYLKDYKKYKHAYVPLGTLEWHGNHLPLETDMLVANRICELINNQIPGYLLPPFYLATDRKNGDLIGMENHLNKQLPGGIYYLKPELIYEVIKALVQNLVDDGYKKIFLVPGHLGGAWVEVLEKLDQIEGVIFINPYFPLKDTEFHARHADENESAIFWACYPEEESKSKAIKIDKDDDFIKYMGRDVRDKASLKNGKIMLEKMVEYSIGIVKENL
jgi:creatinine amidohydrolase